MVHVWFRPLSSLPQGTTQSSWPSGGQPVPFVVAKGQADRKRRALCSLSFRQEKRIGSCLRKGPTTVWRSSKYAGFLALCVGYRGKVQGMGVCLGGVCQCKMTSRQQGLLASIQLLYVRRTITAGTQ